MSDTPQDHGHRFERVAAPTALAVFVTFALVACGGAPEPATALPRVQEHTAHEPPATAARLFDPSKHRADDIREEFLVVIRSIPSPAAREPDPGFEVPIASGSDSTRAVTNGYRVQLYIATRRSSEERAAAIARQRFPEDNVYIVFQGSFHRVRIGDYRTETEARAKVREARQKGYSEPLWVPPESND